MSPEEAVPLGSREKKQEGEREAGYRVGPLLHALWNFRISKLAGMSPDQQDTRGALTIRAGLFRKSAGRAPTPAGHRLTRED